MSCAETHFAHIVLDARGVPRIAGTTMKVVELVTAQTAYGWSLEALHVPFPHLSLGQIHAARANYWEHRDELDHDSARRLAAVDQQQRQTPTSPLRARLRARGGHCCRARCRWISTCHGPSRPGCGYGTSMRVTAFEDGFSDVDDPNKRPMPATLSCPTDT